MNYYQDKDRFCKGSGSPIALISTFLRVKFAPESLLLIMGPFYKFQIAIYCERANMRNMENSMKNLLINFFTSLMILIPASSKGYFYYFEEISNGNKFIYFLSDAHQPMSLLELQSKKRSSDLQRLQLIEAAKKMKSLVIAEDALHATKMLSPSKIFSSINDAISNEFVKNPEQFNPNKNFSELLPDISTIAIDPLYMNTSPLHYITQYCHKESIPVVNVECRFNQSNLIQDYIRYHDKMIQKINLLFSVNPQLYTLCEDMWKEFMQKHSCWEKLLKNALSEMGQNTTYEQIIKCEKFIPSEYGLQKLNDYHESAKNSLFNTHDSIFIDILIMHAIVQSKHSNIIVAAGGTHTDRVKETLLKKSEYKSIRKSSETVNLSNVVDLKTIAL
jgi:hypothetical protein